jgi:hypothetical protein
LSHLYPIQTATTPDYPYKSKNQKITLIPPSAAWLDSSR